MSSTLLEQCRASHEEVERLERLIVTDFKNEARGHKERLYQNHRVRKALDQMQERSAKLARTYADSDGARKEEISSLKADGLGIFYLRLQELQDYHRKWGVRGEEHSAQGPDEEAELKEEPQVEFSGEEGMGRYLDLHPFYLHFINSKFGRQMDYAEYIGTMTRFADIGRSQRLGKAYRLYLSSLLQYLRDFHQRTQPLGNLQRIEDKVAADFQARFEAGSIPGWEDKGEGSSATGTTQQLDLDAFDSVEELNALGAEKLRDALAALGLKSGGTAQQRAERLYSTKGLPLTALPKKLFAKGTAPADVQGAEEVQRQKGAAQQSALLEQRILAICGSLGSVLEDTRDNVEKKQARTYEEMRAEQEEAEQAEEPSDSDEEDDFVYNPLKLPLGWDGKPIPYWLYKLHGLNQEFQCEICGDGTYWGRRAFERHFKEARHQIGMRSLGIPNNKCFYEVTSIADAQALWENMKSREKGGFRAENEEEYEDADGNVYNKRTYEDMKRQGLI